MKKKPNLKKVHAVFEHNLSPFHEQLFMNALYQTLYAFDKLWKQKSVKTFKCEVKEYEKENS